MEACKQSIKVEVVCDLICPWCWIGKRHLEKAVASLSDRFDFEIRWLPFLLRPDMPPEGIPVQDEDFGHPKKKAELKRAKKAGEAVGLTLTFAAPVVPSTVQGHALVKLATVTATQVNGPPGPAGEHRQGACLQSTVVDSIFQAYLTDGKCLTESDLVSIATAAGLNADDSRAFIADSNNLEAVRKEAADWTKRGVTGVPCFYMNGQRTLCGAQDEEMFRRMVCLAAQRAATSPHTATTTTTTTSNTNTTTAAATTTTMS